MDGELCLLCDEPIAPPHRMRCLGSCACTKEKSVCCICFLKMRLLTQTMTCPSCKTVLEELICTDDPTLTYAVAMQNPLIYDSSHFHRDLKANMYIPMAYYRASVEPQTSFRCSICHDVKRSYSALGNHYRTEHNVKFCELCVANKKCFPSEQSVYNATQLRQHERKGQSVSISLHFPPSPIELIPFITTS